MLIKRCPVCNNASSLWAKHPGTDLFRCKTCNHCFSDIESVKVHEDYDRDYYEVEHKNYFLKPHTGLYKIIYHHITKYLGKDKNNISLLDMGCGTGNFLKFIRCKDKDMELIGVDFTLNEECQGITFLKGDLFSIPAQGKYGIVVSLAVIEHVDNVRHFVRRAYELCSHGGLFVVMTVNEHGLIYKVANLLGKIGYKNPFYRLYSTHHVNHFNVVSLKRLVEECGFVLVKRINHNLPLSSIDMPPSSKVVQLALTVFLWILLLLERLTKKTYLQTIVCRK